MMLSALLILVVLATLSSSLGFILQGGTKMFGHRTIDRAHFYCNRKALELKMKVADPYLDIITKMTDGERKDLWKNVSRKEKEAVTKISEGTDVDSAYALLAESIALKEEDPFITLARMYDKAVVEGDDEDKAQILKAMGECGAPPHITAIAGKKLKLDALTPKAATARTVSSSSSSTTTTTTTNNSQTSGTALALEGTLVGNGDTPEEVDTGSTFSDTVTEKIRVKVNSFYDNDKSDPNNGKFMFWYKVAIYNEGLEPVQIVARMWNIEKCAGEVETVKGPGIMSTQPIIPPGEVFTYQSVCPLKVFPPKGKRVLGSMTGAYTMCKGNMGQHNFMVKVSKFNLILPEDAMKDSDAAP